MLAEIIEIEMEVREEDIENGIEEKCDLCPIALALRRHFNHVKVGGDYLIEVWRREAADVGRYQAVFDTIVERNKIVQFIGDFDSRQGVKPFKMNIKFEMIDKEYWIPTGTKI